MVENTNSCAAGPEKNGRKHKFLRRRPGKKMADPEKPTPPPPPPSLYPPPGDPFFVFLVHRLQSINRKTLGEGTKAPLPRNNLTLPRVTVRKTGVGNVVLGQRVFPGPKKRYSFCTLLAGKWTTPGQSSLRSRGTKREDWQKKKKKMSLCFVCRRFAPRLSASRVVCVGTSPATVLVGPVSALVVGVLGTLGRSVLPCLRPRPRHCQRQRHHQPRGLQSCAEALQLISLHRRHGVMEPMRRARRKVVTCSPNRASSISCEGVSRTTESAFPRSSRRHNLV